MPTHLTGFVPSANGTGSRTYYQPQTIGNGIFTDPGPGHFGNSGRNTYIGPSFYNVDLAFTKAFTIHENIAFKFRMDAFNAFNHINAGNPGGYVGSTGTINGEAAGGAPRQLEFSLRAQF